MNTLILLKGISLGFSIAAVVGPIGILCLRRSVAYGFLTGLFTGFGAAIADSIYAIIAVFGLTFISQFLLFINKPLRFVGGAYLIYLGITTFFSKPSSADHPIETISLKNAFLSTFFLTLTNPITIMAFLALFASLELGITHFAQSMQLVFGVFCGSLLWWLILSIIGKTVGKKVTPAYLSWINKISGIIITVFGLATFIFIR